MNAATSVSASASSGIEGFTITEFKHRVDGLAQKKQQLDRSENDTKSAFLDFCCEYYTLHKQAKLEADKQYLADNAPIEKSLRSAYRIIGEHSRTFKTYIAALPYAHESLKELARIEDKKPGEVARLVERRELNAHTSVAAIRAIRQRLLGNDTTLDATSATEEVHEIVLSSSDVTELLESVIALLKATKTVTAKVDGSMYHAGKELLGKVWVKSNGGRYVEAA